MIANFPLMIVSPWSNAKNQHRHHGLMMQPQQGKFSAPYSGDGG
jgi:hypothetical protein